MKLGENHEIYPNAPLEYVVGEIRYPFMPGLVEEATIPKLHRAFHAWLPLVEPSVETTMVVGPAASLPTTVREIRFLARDRTLAATAGPTRLAVETTAYVCYEEFRKALLRSVTAIEGVAEQEIPGLVRIGLRYVDEIRIPDKRSGDVSWAELIDPKLVPAMALSGARLTSSQGTFTYELQDGYQVVMRYGALDGQTVGDAPLRRRPRKGTSNYFLIDIDSSWTAAEPTPEFSADRVLAIADELHRPVRELFESTITDRLREILRSPEQ